MSIDTVLEIITFMQDNHNKILAIVAGFVALIARYLAELPDALRPLLEKNVTV